MGCSKYCAALARAAQRLANLVCKLLYYERRACVRACRMHNVMARVHFYNIRSGKAERILYGKTCQLLERSRCVGVRGV